MKLFFSFAVLIAVCSADLFAQQSGLDSTAQSEIHRRGAMVELTGTIRSGLMAAAFAPPADDSDKWHLTLVVKQGDRDSDYTRAAIEHGNAMRHWVNPSDSKESVMIYQVRQYNDPLQQKWLEGLQPAIKAKGLPCVVVQPPRNGKFGGNATIVKIFHGPYGDVALSGSIRGGITDYVKNMESKGVGVEPPYRKPEGAENPTVPLSAAPPFAPPPPLDRSFPLDEIKPSDRTPFEWPETKPKALTIAQVKEACPGASAEFVMEAIESGETDTKTLALRWKLYRLEHHLKDHSPAPPESVDSPPSTDRECSISFFEQCHQLSDQAKLAVLVAVLFLLYRYGAKLKSIGNKLVKAFSEDDVKIATVAEIPKQFPPTVSQQDLNVSAVASRSTASALNSAGNVTASVPTVPVQSSVS